MKQKKTMAYFQKLSRAFLMPIALLSIASLMTGVASVFLWHDQLKEMFPIITSPAIQYVAKLLESAGGVVTNNLPILYCVSISFSMADEDKEYAAFGALVGYLAFLVSMGFLLSVNTGLAERMPQGSVSTILGYETVNTGVLGAIVVGLISAWIHNRVHTIKLPMALSFFGGVRFVSIATSLFFMVFGQLIPFVWSYISSAINAVAYAVANTGIFGPFFYQLGERLLIPTGMHQIWNTVIRDTAVSGVYVFPDPYGTIEGARTAFAAYMGSGVLPDGASLAEMVKFLRGGQIPITVFALPAVAFAMYQCADADKRDKVKGLLLAGACTSIIAGITEPLEFAFLFAAPGLFVIYSVFCGLAYMIPYILGSTLGGTEASILGLAIFGFLRDDATWWINVGVGIAFAVIMYFVFKWYIVRFNVKTPGRGGDYDDQMSMLDGIIDLNTNDPKVMKAQVIIKGLGGIGNIETVDCCMSRRRVTVTDSSLVDEEIISSTGCHGIIRPDQQNVQIVYGTTVGMIRDAVRKEIKRQQQKEKKK